MIYYQAVTLIKRFFLLRALFLWYFMRLKIFSIFNTSFLLKLILNFFLLWTELLKRGRSDFWTNVTIGRLFNKWFGATFFTYFFFFRSFLSKLLNVVFYSKAFKLFNIFFFFEQVSLQQLLFLFWICFFFLGTSTFLFI